MVVYWDFQKSVVTERDVRGMEYLPYPCGYREKLPCQESPSVGRSNSLSHPFCPGLKLQTSHVLVPVWFLCPFLLPETDTNGTFVPSFFLSLLPSLSTFLSAGVGGRREET